MQRKQAGNELDPDLETMCVAYDYCVLNLPIQLIAASRKLSESVVSRRIATAKQKGYMTDRPVLRLTADQYQYAAPYLYDYELAQKLASFFYSTGVHWVRQGRLIIVPSRLPGRIDESSDGITSRVAAAAANRLAQAV